MITSKKLFDRATAFESDMDIKDDLHETSGQAFSGAIVMAFGILRWLPDVLDEHRHHTIPLIGTVVFSVLAVSLTIRGWYMRREEARRTDTEAEPGVA